MTETPESERWGSVPVERAAREVLVSGLGQGRSTLMPNVQAWRPAVAAELRHRVVDSPITSGGGFLERLNEQLDGASIEVRLLCAELLFLQCVPLVNLQPGTKRARLQAVLAPVTPPVTFPDAWNQAIEAGGVFNGGTGFNVRIWSQLGWLLSFVEYWWQLSDAERGQALGDPWDFRQTVSRTPADQPGIRNCLLYLAFPDVFLPIVNAEHKRRIRDAFADEVGGPTGKDPIAIDRDLARIRARHVEAAHGGLVNYYYDPYWSVWQPTSDDGQRAWLVRPREGGQGLFDLWLKDGFVSLAATYLKTATADADLAAVRAAVEESYQHLDYAQRLSLANEYHMFLSRMKPDDIVLTILDNEIASGLITGEAAFAPVQKQSRLRRAVSWAPGLLRQKQLPSRVRDLFDQQGSVVDVTADIDSVRNVLEIQAPDDTFSELPPSPDLTPQDAPELAGATDELADDLFMSREWLQHLTDLLADRQQIVLYGPPGTGKTFLARAIAKHLAEPDAVRLVQFHPSYAYEDFFEGYRPDIVDGQPTFRLTPGPLRQMAADAAADPGHPYVLIIDELNRANVAKVFGELYYLLEYRHDSVRLQYSPGSTFRLPANVFLIGTMNSADRSIAALDAALRRRFAFVEMHPDEEPVRDLLGSYLTIHGKPNDERAALLEALNAAIGEGDRDFRIGPSYLMKQHAETEGGLERVWTHDLLPLLEEQYYGRLDRSQIHERFGLAALRAAITDQG